MGKKKQKKKSPPQYMKMEDVRYRQRLLERWGFVCFVCGEEFANLACVTKEHIIPRAHAGSVRWEPDASIDSNIAPSHYACNQVRGTDSIFSALRHIKALKAGMRDKDFYRWLNQPVPHRIVPLEALAPITRPWTVVLRSFELAEHLPGMP